MSQATQQLDPNLKTAGILVVDDDAANIKLLERILRQVGYESIVSTQDPLEVEPLLRAHHSDLILLDLNMPRMDGFKVMERIEAMDAFETPSILVVTCNDEREARLRALNSGARDFVTKPFDRAELLSRVRNMLEVQLYRKSIHSQNELLEQKVYERTRELYETRLQVIRRLCRAAEYRDGGTGLHIIRMSRISVLLARAIGLSDKECDLLLQASPMHDVGKIGIPDRILLKPGKLDADEQALMRTHTTIGADILAGGESELLRMAYLVALTHHERWDGSGYPRGLKGDEIPVVGRIVALADVLDALTSIRPYKKAWTMDDAKDLIKDGSGKHFEPNLVKCALALWSEICDIKTRHMD